MKVLLVNPPQTFYPGSDLPAGSLPLGLLYLAAVLERGGFEVEVLNAFMSDASFRGSGDTVEVGMSYGRIRDEIRKRKPSVVGIANPFTCQAEHAIKVANVVKDVDRDIMTVVGGPHVSVVPAEFLEEAKNVDVVVVGEGEYALLDIAKCVEGEKKIDEVQGIAYRKEGKVVLTPPRPRIKNLDELPYPAYHLVDMEEYLNPGKIDYRSFKERAIPMVTRQGVPIQLPLLRRAFTYG